MGLFRKKDKPYRVVHYEGIDTVAMNIPCTFIIKGNILNINFSSGMEVALPVDRIVKFEAMGENDYMMKYKNTNSPHTQKIPTSYLVITYISKNNEEKRIVLWAANHREILYFTELHYNFKQPTENIEL